MKLWLTSDNINWTSSRYHYAAEQMLLTLFPTERPEYPDAPPPSPMMEEQTLPSSLSTAASPSPT